ncbi:MAG: Maf family protein [Phycisphaerales bacterium]
METLKARFGAEAGGSGGDMGRTPRARILLASRSPRRRELLQSHGYDFRVAQTGVDDGLLHTDDRDAVSWVMSLAFLKAAAALAKHADEDWATLVLGADTVCVVDGVMFGQPRDQHDAGRMIETMTGREHEVLTGVALVCPKTRRRELFVDRAVVHVGDVTSSMRDEYLATGLWRGKAGAYNLGERIDAGWPIEYEGDPTSIMGLPMATLAARIEDFLAAASDAA